MVLRLLICFVIFCSCCATHDVSKQCASKLTCHECIETAGCAWCSQEGMLDNPRCFHPNFSLPYISEVCSEEYVYFALNSIEVDDRLPDAPKQILPKKYSLQMRIGDPVYLSIKVNKTEDDSMKGSPLELHHNATKFLKIDFKCLNDAMKPISNCDVIKGGQYVNIKLEALKCPVEQKEWKQDLIVYANNIDDFVHIQVGLLCSCPCERKGSRGYIPKSKTCNSVGTLACGICECDSAHAGKNCECTTKQYSNIGCKPPNGNDTEECSGRGSCICNKCKCNTDKASSKTFSGNWCECDNLSCPSHNGRLCSGNGMCACGRCICRNSWIGEACECSQSVRGCYNHLELTSSICNDRGDCICGECQCHSVDGNKYSGKHCEKCVNCESHCDELKSCVLCQVYKKGEYAEDDCMKKCNYNVTLTNDVEENAGKDEFLCKGQYENKCKYKFIYKLVNGTFEIKAPEELPC